jgi:hypothetical protein
MSIVNINNVYEAKSIETSIADNNTHSRESQVNNTYRI